jgi:murein L,D-transpeptidase YafK
MLRTGSRSPLMLQPRAHLRVCCALVVCLAVIHSGDASAREPQYPAVLLNWMVEGTFHALIVDKSRQELGVWRVRNGEPALIESYRCSTGERDGDKWARGDMKTPEGVYFFCSVIDGEKLPSKYGPWAFTTDYPNFVDRRQGKNGDGIWLHGRDKPLGPKPDSNGCIAMENDDLARVSRYVRLQGTALIIVPELTLAPKSTIIEQERELRGFVESWRQTWESKDVDKFMSHYSPDFQSGWLDFAGWEDRKRKLAKRYSTIKVKLGNIYLYRQKGLITAICTQGYRSDGYQNTGIKMLFITEESGYRIYAEDYHQLVDDPFPVTQLLAKAGVDPAPKRDIQEEPDLRIRLVSTDDTEHRGYNDMELPQPSAPGRAVVLERLDEKYKTGNTPAIAVSQPTGAVANWEGLRLACVIAPDTGDMLNLDKRGRMPMVSDSPPAAMIEASLPKSPDPPQAASRPTTIDPMEVIQQTPPATSTPIAVVPREPQASTQPPRKNPAPEKPDKERQAVLDLLQSWKAAWETKSVDKYMKLYHPEFRCGKMNYEGFFESKRNFFSKYGVIRVEVEQVDIRKVDGRLTVKFMQTFQGDDYNDKGWKSMVMAGSKTKGLRIVSEKWSPL